MVFDAMGRLAGLRPAQGGVRYIALERPPTPSEQPARPCEAAAAASPILLSWTNPCQ